LNVKSVKQFFKDDSIIEIAVRYAENDLLINSLCSVEHTRDHYLVLTLAEDIDLKTDIQSLQLRKPHNDSVIICNTILSLHKTPRKLLVLPIDISESEQKRQYYRVDISVLLRRLDKFNTRENTSYEVKRVNLSGGGISFYVKDASLFNSEIVTLDLKINDTELEITGSIRRKKNQETLTDIGIEFIGLSFEAQNLILRECTRRHREMIAEVRRTLEHSSVDSDLLKLSNTA